MNESRVCNINYDNELNKRLEKRILQSSAIEPQYDRPICTNIQILIVILNLILKKYIKL